MNMKRSVILSLFAVALAAIGMSAAQATVNVALNIVYTDPFDPSEGGDWTLVAKTDTALSQGIVGLVVRFTDIADDPNNPTGTAGPSIGHDILGGFLGAAAFDHDSDPNTVKQTEYVYGQDPNDGLTFDVGLVGAVANQGTDPFFNSFWDDASVIATGTIADLTTRPTFVSAAANESFADPNAPIQAAMIGLTNVRGDSVGVDGLLPGDANRSGTVNGLDLADLATNFNLAGGWDEADFNDSGNVNGLDLADLAANFNLSSTPPAIGAVPEPSALILLGTGFGLLYLARKRPGF
ncbi:MAG: PEP-CTERM sorting domain-containing protein [Planctomycetes bacterium]|nr:PEP-CTERM sorting domain-containing protein [Planctomycetota bacterium]